MEVLPSQLTMNDFHSGGVFSNVRLRMGEVQQVFAPKDNRNINGSFFEYQVYVAHRGNGTVVGRMYENCILANSFGSRADKLTYTLRGDMSAARGATELGVGAKVLILCINGETHNAVIIGGIQDGEDVADDPAKGHNLHFAFNGVDIIIDRDGQLLLNVTGATTADNKPAKGTQTDKLPSTLKIEKDGTITASTKDGKTSITLDQAGHVTVTGDKVTVVANQVELGGAGVGGKPSQGVVLGSAIDTFTGATLFALGSQSSVVFAKK